MERFERLKSIAAPMPTPNIDTDQIIPVRFLRKPRKDGLGRYLFHDLRFTAEGAERPEFVLNRAPYRSARILVAGSNFGCGSSREQAVYALLDYGIRAVVAESFGDIFSTNCLKNGLIPVRLCAPEVATLMDPAHLPDGATLDVDLAAQSVTGPDGSVYPFDIEPFAKHCILNGLDELDFTLTLQSEIGRFERSHSPDS